MLHESLVYTMANSKLRVLFELFHFQARLGIIIALYYPTFQPSSLIIPSGFANQKPLASTSLLPGIQWPSAGIVALEYSKMERQPDVRVLRYIHFNC